MAHTGPKPAPALALAPMLLTGQGHPEPHDRKHQKEKQSHRPALPFCGSVWLCAAVCREATRSCWAPARSTHSTGHSTMSPELGREDAWPPPLVRHFSGASWLAGGSEKGKRNGKEKTTHSLRDTQRAFLPRGQSAVWAPGLSRDLYNPAC